MADAFDSPIDIDDQPSPTALGGRAQVATSVGIAAVLLLLLNAHALALWADGLKPGPRTAGIYAAAQGLSSRTAARGLDAPRATLRAGWQRLQAADWPDQR
ncbi:hypothetical protein [Sandarakinorhabdus rubra]|uniref:hypothetical protein n=1 Tax=Sandarakinorhabdus rubra TaxID=2672568 RepID=UPI0013DD1A30|nr:hypothetical protein [Sandarakinorhabdus rubra]